MSKYGLRKNGTGRVLRRIVKTPNVTLQSENEHLALTAYEVEGALAVHLVNLSDTVAEREGLVAHSDPLTHFVVGAEKLFAMTLTVNTALAWTPARATLYTPEREEPLVLSLARCGDAWQIEIPDGAFSGYALIALEP